MVNGELRRFPLVEMRDGKEQRIEVKGRRPASMMHPEKGDAAFQESYHRARVAHDRLLGEELTKKTVEELSQRIIEAKTGTRLDFVKVAKVAEAWATLPRKKGPPCAQHLEASQNKLRRFADYMSRHFPKVKDLAEVRAEHAKGFLDAEEKRGISARSWNVRLRLLKTVFAKLEPNADAHRSFLRNAVFRDEQATHRKPFSDDESEAILEAARKDDVLRGPIVTAICTAMRKGDCCRLQWSSVEMEKGFVEVRTSKTGERAKIPILPLLREELNQTAKEQRGEFVFPAAAELYANDPHALDRRFKIILHAAGFVSAATAERAANVHHEPAATKPALPELPVEEVRRRGLEAIASGVMIEAKRERMRQIFTTYVDGKGLPTIARELGVSKSTASLHLNAIQDTIGVAVMRQWGAAALPAVIRGTINEDGKGQRLHRGSTRGWQSFRVAFVTRARAGGMPEELVRRVTGHTAVGVVREHYFDPGEEEFRRAFEKHMPDMLKRGAKSRDEQMREIIENVTPKTWKQDKARLLALLNAPA